MKGIEEKNVSGDDSGLLPWFPVGAAAVTTGAVITLVVGVAPASVVTGAVLGLLAWAAVGRVVPAWVLTGTVIALALVTVASAFQGFCREWGP